MGVQIPQSPSQGTSLSTLAGVQKTWAVTIPPNSTVYLNVSMTLCHINPVCTEMGRSTHMSKLHWNGISGKQKNVNACMAYPETLKDYYLNEIKMTAISQKSIHLLFLCQAQTSRRFLQSDLLYQGPRTVSVSRKLWELSTSCTLLPGLYNFLQEGAFNGQVSSPRDLLIPGYWY